MSNKKDENERQTHLGNTLPAVLDGDVNGVTQDEGGHDKSDPDERELGMKLGTSVLEDCFGGRYVALSASRYMGYIKARNAYLE